MGTEKGGDDMTAREVLAQCRTAIAEIAALERMIDKLMDIGAPDGGVGGSSDRVGGRTNDPAAARMQAVDGCLAVLDQRREALAGVLIQLDALIMLLNDGKARTVLRYYYGCGWTDQRIADALETSREVVTRRRLSAVEYICARSQKVIDNHD